MKLNIPFDGSKIQITRVRATDWGGNAVHFHYNGQTYRVSICEDPNSEDESGNRINYARMQIADKNGNWSDDIATQNNVDNIPVSLSQPAEKVRACKFLRYGHEPAPFPVNCRYDRAIPYKFYDTAAFASFLNKLFVQ